MTRAELVADKSMRLHELLSKGPVLLTVAVHVPGVIVPEHLSNQAAVSLSIAYGYNLPWLVTDREDVVLACLKFGNMHFPCEIPWEAIVSMQAGEDFAHWPVTALDFATPPKDIDGVYVIELPRTVLSPESAQRILSVLAAHVGANVGQEDKVRFSLAPLDKSAYTGLKLVVDNTMRETISPDPESVA